MVNKTRSIPKLHQIERALFLTDFHEKCKNFCLTRSDSHFRSESGYLKFGALALNPNQLMGVLKSTGLKLIVVDSARDGFSIAAGAIPVHLVFTG